MEQPRAQVQPSTQPARQTPKKLSQKQWSALSGGEKTLITVTPILFIVLISVVISSAAHNENTSNTSSTQPAHVATTTPAPTSQPATPTKAQQIKTWNTKYGYGLQALANDLDKLHTDNTNPDNAYSQIGNSYNDCKQLQRDTSTAQSLPPIPDTQSASDLSSALSYFSSSAQDCINGVNNNDVSQLQQSGNELDQANAKIQATTTDIQTAMQQ